MALRQWLVIVALLGFMAPAASAQGSAPTPGQAAAFMGTWAFTMTEPDEMKGSSQTVRIWDNNGVLAASVQTGQSPPNEVSGTLKDGDMLVLTISHAAERPMLENGAPICAVITLTRDGDTMKVAHMLERSRTIKRGIGKLLERLRD